MNKSSRGFLLVYQGRPKTMSVVTVENYLKWYELYVVHPDGRCEAAPFPDDNLIVDQSPCMDHVPNPNYVVLWANRQGYAVDSRSIEIIAGRWFQEAKQLVLLQDNDEYSADGTIAPPGGSPSFDVYCAEADGTMVVHVDTDDLPEDENGPLIRIYLNDEVIFENPPLPDAPDRSS